MGVEIHENNVLLYVEAYKKCDLSTDELKTLYIDYYPNWVKAEAIQRILLERGIAGEGFTFRERK